EEPAQRARGEELLQGRAGSEVLESLLPRRLRLRERPDAPSLAARSQARVDCVDQARRGGAERPGGFGRLLRLPRRRRPEPGAVASGAAEPGEEVLDQAVGSPARPACVPLAEHATTC